MAQQTAVEWLAEKYNYVTWMRNRDEISAAEGDEWRRIYLEQAKAMHKQEIIEAATRWKGTDFAEQYYNETYGE